MAFPRFALPRFAPPRFAQLRAAALLVAAIVLPATLAAAATPRANWLAMSAVTPEGGHRLGNPDAAIKLVEWVSYTCPHCATFQKQAETPLRMAYVNSGKVSVEVRHLVRDPVDLAATVLANCGSPANFWRLHNAFLIGQDRWIVKMASASDAQKARWSNGGFSARMRAIAADFGFYAIMEQRGYPRAAVDRCLADEAAARRLAGHREAAAAAGVDGTPSFLLNGLLLTGTHDWQSLELQIKARL